MSTAPSPSSSSARRPWRGWSERSQVERVELYTVQSLYTIVVGLVGVTVGLLVIRDDDLGASTVLAAVLGLGLITAGVVTLREAIRLHPLVGPLPVRAIAALVTVAALSWGVAFTMPGDPRAAVVSSTWGTLALALGGFRDRRVEIPLLISLPLVLGLPAGTVTAYVAGLLAGGFLVFTVRASLWLFGVVQELDTARGAQTSLAVAEERLRFSRDVHDVLGRRLSEIAIAAELAGRLASAGDETAPARMGEIRAEAHRALREARELARGYRPTDLAQEVDGARSLLASAGISTVVDLDALREDQREPAAWVVREAITNVLRHSRATTVRIEYVEGTLRVRNDGSATQDPPELGSGLRGLTERLAPLGGSLTASASGDSFTLVAALGEGADS